MTTRIPPMVITTAATFAALLRVLRVLANHTGATLGRRLGVGGPLIYKRERGHLAVRVDAAAEHLGELGYVLVVMHRDDARRLGISEPSEADAAKLAEVQAAADADAQRRA